MSYEGHVQALCEKGHLNIYDCFYEYEKTLCSCGSLIIWENNVDDTNCDSYGEVDMNQFRICLRIMEECPTCHHKKEISPEIYRIPTEEERQQARCYRPKYGDTPLIPLPKE